MDRTIGKITNLTKKFNKFTAVDNISFDIKEGEILGFLGPNGAGKTTTIHMLLDLVTPDSGEISFFGKNFTTNREEILQQVGFASPYVYMPYRMTVNENLIVYAKLFNLKNPKEKIDELLKLFKIERLKNKPISYLSSGENTKVGLCKALISNPKLLLLDEPTASLDPETALMTRNILIKLKNEAKTTILYTSHNMAEVESMCDRIIFLNHGKIIATGTPMEITKSILSEERKEPALEEVFLKVVKDTNENS